eukprot:SAG11_NODE_268_length_11447_cov_3.136135_9_plen_212_part_00
MAAASRQSPRRENLARWNEHDLNEDIGGWKLAVMTAFLNNKSTHLPKGDAAEWLRKLEDGELTLPQARAKLAQVQEEAQEQQDRAAAEAEEGLHNKGPRDTTRDVGKPPGGRPPAAAVYWEKGWRDDSGKHVGPKRDRKRKKPETSSELSGEDSSSEDEDEVKRIDPGFKIAIDAKWLLAAEEKDIDELRRKALRLNTPEVWNVGTRSESE